MATPRVVNKSSVDANPTDRFSFTFLRARDVFFAPVLDYQ
jgi:hypothetical protein